MIRRRGDGPRRGRHLVLRPLVRAWRASAVAAMGEIPRPDSDGPATVHAPGADADRVLLFGAGPAVGWGVRTHELGLAGGIARALAAATGRGVDVEVHVDPGLTIDRVPGILQSLRLWRYDAVVVSLGVNDAFELTPRSRWRHGIVRVLDQVLSARSRDARVTVLGIQPIRSIPMFDARLGDMVDRQARRLNEVTAAVCAERDGATFVPLPAPPAEPDNVYRSRLGYEQWGRIIAAELAVQLHPETRAGMPWEVEPDSDWADLVRASDGRIPQLVRTAGALSGLPFAAFGVASRDAVWVSVRDGEVPESVPRGSSFTAQTMRSRDGMVVPDARADERFSDNPQVVGPPYVRFFAGYPVQGPTGEPVGALCLFGPDPHPADWIDMSQVRQSALLIQRELNARRRDR